MKKYINFLFLFLSLCLHLSAQDKLENRIDLLLQSGLPDDALEILIKEDYQNNPDINLLLSKTYLQLGRNDIAEEHGIEALQYFRNSDNELKVAECLATLGLIYWVKGQNYMALQYHQNALIIRSDLGDIKSIAASYNDLGLVYSAIDPDMALEYYLMAHAKYTEIYGSKDEKTANSYINIGLVYNTLEKYDSALLNLFMALDINREIYPDGHPTEGFIYASLGQVQQKMENFTGALQNLKDAEKIYLKHFGNKHPELANIYNLISSLELSDNNYEEALNASQMAINANIIGNNINDLYFIPDEREKLNEDIYLVSLLIKGQAFEQRYFQHSLKMKDLEISLDCFESGDKLIDKLRHLRANNEDKLFLSNRANELYESAIRVSLEIADVSFKKKPWYHKAFFYSEKSKAIVLLDAITDANAKEYANIPVEVLTEENELKAQIAFLNQQLASSNESLNQSKLRSLLVETTENYNTLIHNLEENYPDYYQLKYDVGIPGVSELQNILKDNTAVQSYFIGENQQRLYIFRITNSSIKVWDKPLSPELNKYLIGFRNAIIYNLPVEIMSTGSFLYKQLIPGSVPASVSNLIIIPSGRLGITPFEALVSNKNASDSLKDASFLVNKVNVSYQYSTTLLQSNLKKEATNNNLAALFAPVNFEYPDGRLLSELPGTIDEVNNINSLMVSNNIEASSATYAKASETYLKSDAIKESGYIHIASHGVVNETHPEMSCIYLAGSEEDDGSLYSGEIYNLQLKANLVTLSACQTGLGKVAKSEGIIGLTRALFFAGASNMLVSLWKVDDKSTADLMEMFYKQCLTNNHNFSEALGDIKRQWIADNIDKNPYYWASFILVGN